jgi:SAM-dependent methyltransferase
MDSIAYYDKNSQAFLERTIHADVQAEHRKFLKLVPKGGRILDAGCGVGRDSKYFLSQGHEVVSFDASIEMVKLTSNLLGKKALHLLFQEMQFSNEFDAVWANASLLHVPYEGLREVLQLLHKALLPSGIFYASFKYGNSMRQADDRLFSDMDETKIEPYFQGLFQPLEIWKSADTRSPAPSPDKSWLKVIARSLSL